MIENIYVCERAQRASFVYIPYYAQFKKYNTNLWGALFVGAPWAAAHSAPLLNRALTHIIQIQQSIRNPHSVHNRQSGTILCIIKLILFPHSTAQPRTYTVHAILRHLLHDSFNCNRLHIIYSQLGTVIVVTIVLCVPCLNVGCHIYVRCLVGFTGARAHTHTHTHTHTHNTHTHTHTHSFSFQHVEMNWKYNLKP